MGILSSIHLAALEPKMLVDLWTYRKRSIVLCPKVIYSASKAPTRLFRREHRSRMTFGAARNRNDFKSSRKKGTPTFGKSGRVGSG